MLPSNRGFKAKMYGAPYSYLDVKVTGIETEAAKALDLLIALYVIEDSDGDTELDASYIQSSLPSGDNQPISVDGAELYTISMNRM